MATPPGGHVFVSYSNRDRDAVDHLVRALEGAGVAVSWDADLRPGQAWSDVLRSELEAATAVIVVWSPASVTSSFVLEEAALAQTAGKLVPVALDASTAPPPPAFRRLHTIDLSGWEGDGDDRRVGALVDAIRKRALSAPRPAAPAQARARTATVGLDLEQFSETVRGVEGELTGAVTASAIAAALQARHPEYAGQGLAGVSFTDAGDPAEVDEWLRRVRELYDLDEVAASRDGVISGRLVLVGLSLLDPVLSAALEPRGVLDRLRAEMQVQPRVPVERQSADVGFAADLVSDAHPLHAADDVLGIEDDVRTLCRLVMARSTSPPLAVGLFGDWGTGKSFFLQRMRTRIVEMSEEARTSAIGLGSCERVIQVTFNAWHYLDADLWASLANRLYQGIARSPLAADEFRRRMFEELASTREIRQRAVANGRAATDELAVAEEALADRTRKLTDLHDGRLAPADAVHVVGLGVAAPTGAMDALGTVGELAADARFGHGLVRRVLRETSTGTKVLTGLAVLLAATATVAALWLGWTGTLAAFAAPVVTAVIAWATGLRDALGTVRARSEEWQRLRDAADIRLRAEVDELRTQIVAARASQREADETLTELREGGLVRRYLLERAQSAAYRDRLGLVSLVREDLEALVQLLDPVSGDRLGTRIDRIVLYVDDLDRCPPARVVEVLQAVHLLLAFPLFVVVVAVDARWLVTALELHYRELLGHDDRGVTFADWELTPSNYLEKIFQIPFVLRPMTGDGYERLIRRLAPVRARGTDRAGELPAETEPGSADGAVSPVASGTAPEVREPGGLLRASVAGTPLGLRFSVDGQWLVVVTTDGIWRWERSRTDLLREPGGGGTLAAISPGARVVAVLDDEGWLSVTDVATGEVHRELVAADRRPVELAAADTGAVVAATEAGELVWLAGDALGGAEVQNRRAHDLHLTADGRSLGWREGRDGRDVRVATGDHSMAYGPWADGLALARDGELLTSYDGSVSRRLRREWEVDPTFATATAIVTSTPHYAEPVPDDVDLARGAARALGAWWLLGTDGRLWLWPDDGAPTADPVTLTVDRIVADPSTSLVVGWGRGGFQVADAGGVRYQVGAGITVDLAAISPLGRLVATVGGDELRFWEVAGSGVPEQPSQLELEPEEADFLVALAQLIDTPRMAKRLVNVYRLLRASAVGRVGLSDPSTGDYRVALLLLAMVVAHPELADEVLTELGSTTSGTWTDLLSRLLESSGRSASSEVSAERGVVLRRLIVLSSPPTPLDVDRFRAWGEHAGRFHVAPR